MNESTAYLNKVFLENSRLRACSDVRDGATYAFYLYYPEGIEKHFYSKNSIKLFNTEIKDGTYKIAFYIKDKEGVIERNDKQIRIVNNKILEPEVIEETNDYKFDYYDNKSDIA